MNWKSAAVRGARTFLQAAAAALLAFYLSIKGDGTFINIKAHGSVLAFGMFLAVCAAVVSFAQNLIEDNTSAEVPKG